MNALEYLKQYTRIVADTGDIDEIRRWQPEEATTNPTLLLNVFKNPQYGEAWLEAAYQFAKTIDPHPTLALIANTCALHAAKEILPHLSGRISLEVDAHLAFDTQATINTAQQLVYLAQALGLDTQRILIKIAATWEGIQAMHALEVQDIHCNGTLIFNNTQALACAQAGATLISPFVGRIYDWYQAHPEYKISQEYPGVSSVKRIFVSLKSQHYATEIMGASFRNTQQILELTGCDRLTIAPKLLQELEQMPAPEHHPLKNPLPQPRQAFIDAPHFLWQMNQDPMAVEKLSEGIRLFALAFEQLVAIIQAYLTRKGYPVLKSKD